MILNLVECLFWFCVGLLLHTYLVFPLLIHLIARVKKNALFEKNSQIDTDLPEISIIIAAYNEEQNITRRILNISEQHYPENKLHVLVGSDGSTDGTSKILLELATQYSWLRVAIFDQNRGKSAIVNDLVAMATTDLLVFTDADVSFEPRALQAIVAPFCSARVGAVGGTRITAINHSQSEMQAEESAYLSFDNRIRRAEGHCGFLIGAHGCFFAMRRSCFRALPENKAYTDDFYYSMLPFEQGFSVVTADSAIVLSQASKNMSEDFQRKVRYSSTGFATLIRFKSLLFDRRILLSYCFWSHRVSKWFVPIFLLTLVLCTMVLQHQSVFYFGLFLAEIGFSVLCAFVYVWQRLAPSTNIPRLLTFSYYFVSSNAALLFGLLRFLSGKNSTQWKPQR